MTHQDNIRKNNQTQDKNRTTPTGGMGGKSPHAPGAGSDKQHNPNLGNKDFNKNSGQSR